MSKWEKYVCLLLSGLFITAGLTGCGEPDKKDVSSIKSESKIRCSSNEKYKAAKPVIYLYPAQKQDVTVKLGYQGKLTCTYPDYSSGWNVTAYPDGKLINKADGNEYSYLFWEGEADKANWDLSKGYVIEGVKTKNFLQKKLAEIGLTPREYNEFIVYWLPKMQGNKYNLITFQTAEYEKIAPLDITPKPDSMLRVFMAFKPLNDKISVEKPVIKPFVRKGFTVVEWGGTEL